METLVAVSMLGLWTEYVFPVLLLILGLGAVIFVHELGHFVVAKLVGIKVERFAFGFGKRLFGFQLGETDYCVNLLPLGGYVKMLGQEDLAPVDSKEAADPRAFTSKSVGARFAVISAGVIMNVIFAAVLFIVVCMVGIRFPAAVVGGVVPGYPASEAKIHWENPEVDPEAAQPTGLRPGDRIVELDGDEVTRFQRLMVAAALAKAGETFRLRIVRPTPHGDLRGTAEVGVKRGPVGQAEGELFRFGIERPNDTVFAGIKDARTGGPFRKGDRLLAVAGKPIHHAWDLDKAEEQLTGEKVPVTVERDGKRVTIDVQPVLRMKGGMFFQKDGTRGRIKRVLEAGKDSSKVELVDGRTMTLTKENQDKTLFLLDVLGCRPRLCISVVSDKEPADKAGLEPNDILLSYGDRLVPSFQDIRDVSQRSADADTTIVVQRDGSILKPKSIKPKKRKEGVLIGIIPEPDMSAAIVSSVRANSPAAKAGLMHDDRIVAVTALAAPGPTSVPSPTSAPSPAATRGATRPTTAPATRPAATTQPAPEKTVRVANWADMVRALGQFEGRRVRVSYLRGAKEQTTPLVRIGEDVFDADDYKLSAIRPRHFAALMGPEVKKGPLDAIAWGTGETSLQILRTYAMIRSLATRRVPTNQVMGPLGIGSVAIEAGRESVIQLAYLMAIISISLAVINFLPIPVVDGGHAVFLLIEKIRGKPVPLRVMYIVQMIGLALLLFVFVWVTWQDIVRLFGG